MSPPEIWGPAVWTLFHTLSEKIHENAYKQLSPQLFNFIVRICKFLPCPDCSIDASIFLATVKLSDYKTKDEFKNLMYLFHNRVNYKRRKPLFNYGNMNIYYKYNTINVINNFIDKYQTKGNMKLLTESFQRKMLVTDFKRWIINVMPAFLPKIVVPTQIQVIEEVPVISEEEPIVNKEVSVITEEVSDDTEEEPVIYEEVPVITEEAPVISEEVPVISEEKPIVNEEPGITEGTVIKVPVITDEPDITDEESDIISEEEPIVTEEVSDVISEEEPVISEEVPIISEGLPVVEETPKKTRKSKKSKK